MRIVAGGTVSYGFVAGTCFQLLHDFFVFPNIFFVRSSSENVLHVGLEYGYLSCKYVVFSFFSLIYA